MSPDSNDARSPSLIDIEVLDLGPLHEQAVRHYLSLAVERADWPPEKRARLRIRTECRWGRVLLADEALFLLNEKGEGPREPLSHTVRANVALYAELLAGGGDPGYFESKPFCLVQIDRDAAATFRALGLVALEDFIRAKIPEMQAAYLEWLALLRKARDRAKSPDKVRQRG